MKKSKEIDFVERRNAAAEAKKRVLEKLKAGPGASDPATLARRAERVAVASARDERRDERERAKLELLERQQAEEIARVEAERAAQEAEKAAKELSAAKEAAQRKAERDRRYAARAERAR